MAGSADDVEPLTTRDAWKEMARWWDNASVCGCGCRRQVVMPNCAGLCSALGIMRHRGYITSQQEERMLATLPEGGIVYVRGVRPFLWPTDEEGAKQRAAFCREQAKNLAKGGA